MTINARPTGATLFAAAAQALKERVDEVNRLNVFPVPDGDTGTNMSLTLDAVCADLDCLASDAGLPEICSAITHGSLMGARGNSGVILSQMLRGLCEIISRADDMNQETVASALERSVTVAFQAVRKPVEGTMLTVLKDASITARAGVKKDLPMEEYLDSIVVSAFESVRRGPDLLPVLKENGVVDAGGLGVAILAEGFVAALAGHEFRSYEVSMTQAAPTVVPVDDWDDEEYLYCTEFLLHGAQADRSFIEEYISKQGGSELVVGDTETYKIHVHTDDPGTALSWATGIGEVSEVHVNNMRRQTAQRRAALAEGTKEVKPEKPVGFVAVAAGEGMSALLHSLGADSVVCGGQTMNPSTAELLEAVGQVNAESVIILPNNRNIVMAAQQVIGVADRPVAVVPTTAVPQAFAALLAYDGSEDLEVIAEEMTEAASFVKSAEVTTAVKDSKGKAGAIEAGQIIGIVDHEIEVIGSDIMDVTSDVLKIITDEGETITVLAGEDFDNESLEKLVSRLGEEYPDFEIEGHRGDQPVYPVIVSVE